MRCCVNMKLRNSDHNLTHTKLSCVHLHNIILAKTPDVYVLVVLGNWTENENVFCTPLIEGAR